ncbi:MAG TPA: aromatic amino acid lyase, partial [Myxococcota bacterium]|nr:aromatic amino acid lyase [Myxococcota bacterium]
CWVGPCGGCWPASADSIPTCEDQEDHVAMSTTAAWRLREVVQNSRRVVAVELLCAARALHFRQQEDAGVRLGVGAAWAMERLAKLPEEGVASEQIEAIARLIEEGLEGPCA